MFPSLLELEELECYKNEIEAKVFTMCISEQLLNIVIDKVERANFVSLLTDGSADSSTTEKELI